MRKRIASLALILTAALVTSAAHSEDWGCQVLLCLSNPGGSKQFEECREPMDKLRRHLARGYGFPPCEEAGGSDGGGSWAQQVYEPFDPCPNGLRPALAGSYVAPGQLRSSQNNHYTQATAYELADRPNISEMTMDDNGNAAQQSARACVGNLVGEYTQQEWNGDSAESYTVYVFDQVTWQMPLPPAAIDVYIDGQWHRRDRD